MLGKIDTYLIPKVWGDHPYRSLIITLAQLVFNRFWRDMRMNNMSDVPCNWRVARLGDTQSVALSVLELHKIEETPCRVFVPYNKGDDVIEIRDWISTNTRHKNKVKLFSRYKWDKFDFETIRTYIGLSFEFEDITDLIFFKMRWQAPT